MKQKDLSVSKATEVSKDFTLSLFRLWWVIYLFTQLLTSKHLLNAVYQAFEVSCFTFLTFDNLGKKGFAHCTFQRAQTGSNSYYHLNIVSSPYIQLENTGQIAYALCLPGRTYLIIYTM